MSKLIKKWKKASAGIRTLIALCGAALLATLLVVIAQDANNGQFFRADPANGTANLSDTNPASYVWIQWGNTNCVLTNAYINTGPSWWIDAWKSGGEWTGSTWHVEASDTNPASLNIGIDTNGLGSLVMRVDYFDHANASLYVGYYDSNYTLFASDLVGNVIEGSNEWVSMYMDLAPTNYSGVAGVSVWRKNGEITVSNSVLYVDETLDELQAGQSDLASNGVNVPGIGVPPVSPSGVTSLSATSSPAISPEAPASTNAAGNVGNGTNAAVKPLPSAASRFIWVDRQIGSDTLSGHAMAVAGNDGPKKTICAGLAEAGVSPSSTLVIRTGSYGENLNVAGRDISVVISGNVDISGYSGDVIVPPPPVTQNSTNVVGVSTNSGGK